MKHKNTVNRALVAKNFTKLFTLLMMAAMSMGAMASTVEDLVAIDNDWTFIAERYTANGTVGFARNELYAEDRIFTPTGNSVATNKGNSYINGIARKNCLRLKNVQDRLAFKVSGACTVTFYTPDENRGVVVSKADRTSTGDAYYAQQPANTPIWTVALDEAGVYYLSNWSGDFYIAGFEVKYAAPAWQKIAIDLRSGQLGTEGTNMQKYVAIDGEENYSYSDAEPGSYNAILSANSYNGSDHGYVGLKATVPVEAGIYKISLGTCKFGADGTGYVKNSDESSILSIVNAYGQTVSSFNQKTDYCYHQDVNSHKVCVWYTATEAETINILGGPYTPYFSIERVNTLPELKYLVIYKNETVDVEGVSSLPKFDVLDEGDEIAVPINRKLYKAGYTWQGWNDGSVTHAPGTSFVPTALTTTLTTVFTANKYGLNESVDDLKIRWEFHRANGAPLMQWENSPTSPDLLVTQANLNGHTIDVPLYVNTNPTGKFNNASNDHTCQVNDGTTFTFPSISGITVKTYSNYEPTTSTLDGNAYDSYNNHLTTYSSTNESGTATLVNYNGRYYEYLEMTVPASGAALPLVKEITVDGVAMDGAVLAGLNYEDDHSATFSGNIYTAAPEVKVTYSNDDEEIVSATGTGTSRTYSFSKTISAVEYNFTFTVEGVHVYTPTIQDETEDIKWNGGTTVTDEGNKVWTRSDNQYVMTTSDLTGYNEEFKFDANTDAAYTITIPSTIVVKQFIIKNFHANYSGGNGQLKTVTSEGATTIIPTKNYCVYNGETTAPNRTYEGPAYDLIVPIYNHTAGTPIVFTMVKSAQPMGWIQLVVSNTYTRTHAHKNLNTLCFPYQVDSYTGATFYSILSTKVEAGDLTELVLEEHVGALDAGVPYFYDPDPEASELVCHCSGTYTAVQAGAGGLTGFYADNTAVPEGSYATVNNQLYKCGAGVTMGEYRAYVDPTVGAYSRAAMPGRRRLTIGGKGTPTGVESILPSEISSQKILRDGQVIIIRGDKMYNVMGQEVR